VEGISGRKLEEAMHRKRVGWAASVYGRSLQELREVAENILKETWRES